MKFETGVLALGLAGSATATTWADWASASSVPDGYSKTTTTTTTTTKPAATSTYSYDPSHTWADWTSSSSSTPAASTKTTTKSSTYSTPAGSTKKTTTTPAGSTKKTTTTGSSTETCDDGSTWVDWSVPETSSVPAGSTTSSKPAVVTSSTYTDPGQTWGDWSSASVPAGSTTSSKPAVVTSSTYTDPGHTWADWSSSSVPADGSKTSSKPAGSTASSAWAPWSSASGVADASKSSSKPAAYTAPTATGWWTPAAGASTPAAASPAAVTVTTTVYASTVYVGAGDCTKTVYPSTCGGAAPSGPAPGKPDPASSKPAATSSAPAAGGWGPGSSSPAASTGKITAVVSPTGLKPGIPSASIIGSNSQVYTWTGDGGAKPTASAAPTYAGWGDWHGASNGTGSGLNGTGPAAGTDASNVTAPFPSLAETSCNTAADRSKWCGKYSIDTDYYEEAPSTGKVCSADWVITNTTMNYDGTPRLALAINGQVPGPLLECNWGDTISVTITNQLKDNATTIHWHGVLQKGTNDQDGVPGITECAVAPGQTRTYTYKANQYGTGWYHSHVYTQYGDGIRGPMVIHGPATANYDIDAGTVMIDDLFGIGKPMTVAEANAQISRFGPIGTANYMLNGANVSPDLKSGKHALWKVKSGKKYLFRMINSASANMWSVHFDNHKMRVISTDYVPITPYTTEWLNIGIGQRYDVIVEMDQPKAGYFLRAAMQTGCPSGGPNNGLGNANGMFVYDDAPLTLPTSTAGNATAAQFAICADEPLASLSPYLQKSGGSSDQFSASAALMPAGLIAQVQTPDDGQVFRWFINNGAINVNFTQPTLQSLAGNSVSNTSVSNYITLTQKNVWVYFVIQNQFFAAHPMHLHGHDMSILGQGNSAWNPSLANTLNFKNPARRDTAMLSGGRGPGSPPGYTVIGFQTDNPGAWVMHCHIIWHVDGGLALQFIERPDEIPAEKYCGASFDSECSSLQAYDALSPSHVKTSGSSGLKARYAESMLHGDVVRKSAEREYLDNYVRRGLGDTFRARHGARR